MRYSSLNGGKRLRPFLVVESAAVFGIGREAGLLAGAALECIHCYSLVHDDLPAMDNSDLRRGRPTLHKAYDDATAILAGDALLTLAFDIITRDEIHRDAGVRLALTRADRAAGVGAWRAARCSTLLARAGSVTASRSTSRAAAADEDRRAVALWPHCRRDPPVSRKTISGAHDYGRALGGRFQIDDLLDVEGDTAALGKQTGQDAALGKTTFVTQLDRGRQATCATRWRGRWPPISRRQGQDAAPPRLFVAERRN